MLDIGWSEMLIVAVVALLVIGPKDLPKMLHTIGRYAGKVRAIAREFQDSIDDAVRETELAEVKKQLDNAGNFDLKKTVTEAVDPDGKIAEATDMSALNKKFSFGGTPPKEEAELEAEVAAEVAEEDAPAAIETQAGEAAEPAPEHAVKKPEPDPDPDPDLDPEPPRAPASLAAGAVAAAEALNKAKAAEAAAQAETAAQADATEPKPESTGA
jgi:sec-independent protein translocase protein TatB